MANMTRLQLRDELKKRGWSRFLDADLDRYLDWALQAIGQKAKFQRQTLNVATISGTVLDKISYTAIAGGAEAVRQISKVYAKQGTAEARPLDPATDVQFHEVLFPNSVSPNPVTAAVPSKYYVYDGEVYIYPKPQSAIDVLIHHFSREDTFSGDGDTSMYPERFDKPILDQAEGYCAERARDYERAAIAFGSVDRFVAEELHLEATQMGERQERVLPYRA